MVAVRSEKIKKVSRGIILFSFDLKW